MKRKCVKCDTLKNIKDFSKDKSRKNGFHPYCKNCVKKVSKPYFDSHRAEANNRSRKWYRDNEDRVKDYYSQEKVKSRRRKYMKLYRTTHKNRKRETAKQYESKRCREDVNYKLAIGLRKRLGAAIKNGQKSGSAVKDLGCTVEFLKQYLESQFKSNMTWSNWGLGIGNWQIDHIVPLCSFDLAKREEFLKASHYTNLQPLWYEEHLNKTALDIVRNNCTIPRINR